MTTHIVMIARDRPRLTRQALESLWAHTPHENTTISILDDGSAVETEETIRRFAFGKDSVLAVRVNKSRGIVGLARNFAIEAARQYWKPDSADLLYLSDNDAYFTPGWLDKLKAGFSVGERDWNFLLMAGYTHPYHKPISMPMLGSSMILADPGIIEVKFEEYDAIGGFSQMMRWQTWDEYGPLDAHAQGVCQSEDFQFCQKIRKAGYKVGCLVPHVSLNAGLTSTGGTPAVGQEAMVRLEGVLME